LKNLATKIPPNIDIVILIFKSWVFWSCFYMQKYRKCKTYQFALQLNNLNLKTQDMLSPFISDPYRTILYSELLNAGSFAKDNWRQP
jgi:hypothetical protein